jgi:hypothetical protein
MGVHDDIMARDAFINCLNDEPLRLYVLDHGAQTIQQAYALCVKYESYRLQVTDQVDSEGDGRRVRGIQGPDAGFA